MVRSDKIDYLSRICAGKDVLHLGCVQSEENIETDQWLHASIDEVSDYCLGLDTDKNGISKMESKSYDVVVGDAQDFSLDREFEVIVAGEIIEHIPNPGGMFESAVEHLSNGGNFVITTPNPFSLIRFVTYLSPIHGFDVFEEHIAWYDRITLRQFAARYGFTESDYYYPRADSLGATQIFHKLGVTNLEDDFIGVYKFTGK